MRALLIISIAFGFLHGVSRASESDSLKQLDSLFAPVNSEQWGSDCYPALIEGKCPQPDYPVKALADSVEGKVHISVHFDTTGHVDKWRVVQEKPEGYGFGQAAEKVIVKWEFTPCIESGRPKSSWVAIPFKFRLPK